MGASYDFKRSKTGPRAPRNLTPGGALSSTYLSLRWSPSVAGGAVITGALPDVMPTQWRVEWTALAGCVWRSPSLGAMSGRRPRARTSKLTNYVHLNIGSPGGPGLVGSGAWAVGELIGAVCKLDVKVIGASYDFKETKTSSGAQCGYRRTNDSLAVTGGGRKRSSHATALPFCAAGVQLHVAARSDVSFNFQN